MCTIQLVALISKRKVHRDRHAVVHYSLLTENDIKGQRPPMVGPVPYCHGDVELRMSMFLFSVRRGNEIKASARPCWSQCQNVLLYFSSGFFVLSQKGGLSKGQRPPKVEPVPDFSLPPIPVFLLLVFILLIRILLTVVLVLVQIVVLLPEAFSLELEACLLLFFLSSSSSSPPSAPRSHLPPLPSLLSYSSSPGLPLLLLLFSIFLLFILLIFFLLSFPFIFLFHHFPTSPLPVIKKLLQRCQSFPCFLFVCHPDPGTRFDSHCGWLL